MGSLKPTYKILSSYDDLIDKGDGKGKLIYRNGNIDDDITVIEKDCEANHGQVKRLAAHLKDPSQKQSDFNVYHWIKTNIHYRVDPPGIQKIRTPAGIYRERKRGVDCKGMAIMGWSLLYEMGYTPDLIVVAFSNNPEFSHIFSRDNGTIIDCVPTMKFDKYAPHITKRMRISLINGVPGSELGKIKVGKLARKFGAASVLGPAALLAHHKLPKNAKSLGKKALIATTLGPAYFLAHHKKHAIHGIGAIALPDKITEMLMDRQTILLSGKSGLNSDVVKKELKKTRYLIMLNGMPERNIVLHLMSYVDRIDKYGKFVYKDHVDLETLSHHIGELEEIHGLGEEGLYDEGLGKKSAEQKAAKKAQKKADKKENKEINKKRTLGGKIFHKLSKYNPAEVVMRNSVLAILGVNLFGISKKLKLGFYTEADARAKGFDMEEYGKLHKALISVSKIWDKLGGDPKKFKNTIVKGGHGLKGPEVAAVTAAPFITKVVAILGKINFKKLLAKAPALLAEVKAGEKNGANGGTVTPVAMEADSPDSGTSTAPSTPVNVNAGGDPGYDTTLKNKADGGTPQNAGYNSDADAAAADKVIPDSTPAPSSDDAGADASDTAADTDTTNKTDAPKSSGGSITPWLIGGGVAAKLLFF
jgi:hypothetical protein